MQLITGIFFYSLNIEILWEKNTIPASSLPSVVYFPKLVKGITAGNFLANKFMTEMSTVKVFCKYIFGWIEHFVDN